MRGKKEKKAKKRVDLSQKSKKDKTKSLVQFFFFDAVWLTTIYRRQINLQDSVNTIIILIRIEDRPLENLWGGGGAKYKKILAQGKIEWKKFLHAS